MLCSEGAYIRLLSSTFSTTASFSFCTGGRYLSDTNAFQPVLELILFLVKYTGPEAEYILMAEAGTGPGLC